MTVEQVAEQCASLLAEVEQLRARVVALQRERAIAVEALRGACKLLEQSPQYHLRQSKARLLSTGRIK